MIIQKEQAAADDMSALRLPVFSMKKYGLWNSQS